MEYYNFDKGFGNPTGNFKQLVENITHYSENKKNVNYSKDDKIYIGSLMRNWEKTSSEWEPMFTEENTEGVCECGRSIRNLCHIRNIVNGKELIVGSHCVNQFENKKMKEKVKNMSKAQISSKKLKDNKKIRLKIKFIRQCCDRHKYIYKICENHNELILLLKNKYILDNIIEKNDEYYIQHWKIENRKTINCILINSAVKCIF